MDDFTTLQPARQGPASRPGENATLAACLALFLLAVALGAPGYVERVHAGHNAAVAAGEGTTT